MYPTAPPQLDRGNQKVSHKGTKTRSLRETMGGRIAPLRTHFRRLRSPKKDRKKPFASPLRPLLMCRPFKCGCSSVGRALPCQGRCRVFESRHPLHSTQCEGVAHESVGNIEKRNVLRAPGCFRGWRFAQRNSVHAASRSRNFRQSSGWDAARLVCSSGSLVTLKSSPRPCEAT